MDRKDKKETATHTWAGNYNSYGSEFLDFSTTELSGSRREADLVVRGLKALQADVIAREAAGIETRDGGSFGDESLGKAPQLQEVEALLGQIALPNYVGEPVHTEM